MYRAAWLPTEWRTAQDHFRAAGTRETAAFALMRWGASDEGGRLLIERVLLPPEGGLEDARRDFLRPSGQWLSAVISKAIDSNAGLAFLHSHPGTNHPPTLSSIDRATSLTWSRTITPTVRHPFASLIWSPSGMTGVVFLPMNPSHSIALDRIEVLGDGGIQVLDTVRTQYDRRGLDDRQIRAITALGNQRIRRLAVGVIGAGGTGSPVAEQLVRIGAARVVLVDPDRLDDPSNVRRVVGSRPKDAAGRRLKVDVVAEHLRSLGLETEVEAIARDVREEAVVRRLLDCDVVVNTTDTQSSRALINQVAYQYWLPIVDVGVRVGTKRDGTVSGMPAEMRVLLPDNGCLWCRGVLDSQSIYEENLPTNERQRLAAESYVQGTDQPQPSITPLNHLAASIAVLTLVKLYSGERIHHASVVVDVWEQFVHVLSETVDAECPCSRWRGRADDLHLATLPAGRDAIERLNPASQLMRRLVRLIGRRFGT